MVLDGVPYSLYRYDCWSILNPCNCCDLSPICLEEDKEDLDPYVYSDNCHFCIDFYRL